MNIKKLIGSVGAAVLITIANAQYKKIAIIPRPSSVVEGKGIFRLTPGTKIYSDPELSAVACYFSTFLKQATGYTIQTVQTNPAGNGKGIYLHIDKKFADTIKGAYTLAITPASIIVKAADGEGVFNGIQSIRQLLPAAVESKQIVKNTAWTLPVVTIKDAPQYAWRGYMKDVSRTFYNVAIIKKYLDIMALYKMNVFHFHLSDDQGWRIEIKQHPELTSVKATVFGATSRQPAHRSGYYTQKDIKDLVAYAAERNIMIVPEIDVPGHCWPVIITNPHLGVNDKTAPDNVVSFMDSYNHWGNQMTPNPLDPTKEAVYTFLDDIFTEIAALFPGKYIHFGGDEVQHRFWEKATHVQAFMKEKNMTTIKELQSYFVQRVSKIIVDKGKIPIGWNDILDDAANLPKSTAIMSWLGSGAVHKAAKHGFYTIASPASPLYFDITQKDRNDGTMSDLNYGGANTMERVYAYDPLKELAEHEKKYVLGIQANMWTALPQEVKDVNVQNFPRLLAVAEIGWTSGKDKNFDEFKDRVGLHYARLDTMRVDYYKEGGYIIATWTPQEIDTAFKVFEWDVTPKVYANGSAQAGFFYTGGASFLKVKNVKLLEDGKEIAADLHESLADKFRGTPFKKNMFFYTLPIARYNSQSRYTLQAAIAGAGSHLSQGNITFNLSPDQPFVTTEALK